MKTQIVTDRAPKPSGAYSQGILMNGWLFTAGISPVDPDTGKVVEPTIEAQTTQVIRNLEGILQAANMTVDSVAKVTVHLAQRDRDFAAFDATYRNFFREPFPVRTTVGSQLPGILVEIDFIAGPV